ncbi:MAG: HAD family hydrolase [Desulfovibrionaceae bacterium]
MDDTTLSALPPRPAVFFDRDGVLNVDKDFVYKIADLEWIEGAMDAVRWCNEHGYWVFVVTNQSGIARGYYTEADMRAFHQHMQHQLNLHGASIDAFAHCPHHPHGIIPAYTCSCHCRKPEAGLITTLLQRWPVDRAHSLLVGDSPRDMEAAHKAGIHAALFSGGNLLHFLQTALPRTAPALISFP